MAYCFKTKPALWQFCAEAQNCCDRIGEITCMISPRGLSVPLRHGGKNENEQKISLPNPLDTPWLPLSGTWHGRHPSAVSSHGTLLYGDGILLR